MTAPYEIAGILKRTRNWNVKPIKEDSYRELGYLVLDFLVVEFANYLQTTEEDFDRDKFFQDSDFRKDRMQELLNVI